MTPLLHRPARLARPAGDRGAAAVEYALFATIVAVVMVVAFALGGYVKGAFQATCDAQAQAARAADCESGGSGGGGGSGGSGGGAGGSYGDGAYSVGGGGIPPGRFTNTGGGPGCRWTVTASDGGTRTGGAGEVTISATDSTFQSTSCGTWVPA